jgi:hypothetical protein
VHGSIFHSHICSYEVVHKHRNNYTFILLNFYFIHEWPCGCCNRLRENSKNLFIKCVSDQQEWGSALSTNEILSGITYFSRI